MGGSHTHFNAGFIYQWFSWGVASLLELGQGLVFMECGLTSGARVRVGFSAEIQ